MSIVLIGSTSGSITLQEPAVSGSTVIDLPATSGTMVVTGGAQTVQFAAGSASTPSITFTGDTNTGIFSPGADTIAFTEGGTEAMRIDSSGNVGIGTSSPGDRIHAAASVAAGLSLQATGTGGSTWRFLSTDNAASIGGGYLGFNNGSYRMVIDSSGNLGVGTSSPNTRIQSTVGSNGSGVVVGLRLQNVGTTAGDGAKILFTAGTSTNGAGISSTGVALDSADLRFETGGSNERMRIGSSGQLFYNCTAEPSSSVKGWGLFLTGSAGSTGQYVASATTNSGNFDHYYFYSVSGLAGFIRTNGTTTTYNSVSDVRLKENIIDAPSALSDVASIKVRSFDWKSTQSNVKYGFIAQELNEVTPDAVAEGIEENDIWAVDTSMLVPMLTKAIQEQQAIITDLKARIETLENK